MVHRHHGAQNALRFCLHTKISANSGVDQGCPLSTCGFSAAIDPPYAGPLWHTSAGCMIQVPSSLPIWTTDTCGSNRSAYYRQSLSSQQPPDQSTLHYSPPRNKSGEALATTPFLLSSKTRSHSHSAAWEDIYKSMETLSPALSFWVSRPPWRKHHNGFRKIATTLADLNAEGLNVQAVNDLLTMYVGAASQHVLRMSFVPEQEAQNFDRQVTTFWSHLIQRDITSLLFFLPLKQRGDLVWPVQFSAMLLPHGALDSR